MESTDSAKYLSINISNDLNWNHHIDEITSKANRTLGFVKSNVKTQNEYVKELAYKTLVRPQVEYASSVWNPYTDQNIDKIEMLQRRAARWVKNSYPSYDSVSNMLEDGYHDLPERTETDRNGPKRTGTDRNGLSWIPKRTFWVPKRTLLNTETDRDGPERTETDRNGPKRTFVDTETDFLGTETDFLGTETDFLGIETDFSGYRNGLFGYKIVIRGA